jgi:hypothetical protein
MKLTMKKLILFLLGIGLLVFGIGLIIFFLKPDSARQLTFIECEEAGGEAWRVDLYHPDICPACVEYRVCELDKGVDCPQVIACTECMKDNFPYPGRCPGGREKIGEISDAAIWFQCCK